MILTGGHTPIPSNDVWVSEGGLEWRFVGNALWAGRTWHASVVFNGRLLISGGSPLKNDAWRLDVSFP